MQDGVLKANVLFGSFGCMCGHLHAVDGHWRSYELRVSPTPCFGRTLALVSDGRVWARGLVHRMPGCWNRVFHSYSELDHAPQHYGWSLELIQAWCEPKRPPHRCLGHDWHPRPVGREHRTRAKSACSSLCSTGIACHNRVLSWATLPNTLDAPRRSFWGGMSTTKRMNCQQFIL